MQQLRVQLIVVTVSIRNIALRRWGKVKTEIGNLESCITTVFELNGNIIVHHKVDNYKK